MKKHLFLLLLCFQFSIGQIEVANDSIQPLEKVPVFPGCEKGDNESQKLCMSEAVQKHIEKRYRAHLVETLDLPSGKIPVYAMFKVDKNGDVVDVKARAPHRKLEEEAIRVINLLPKMRPGMVDGKPVIVPYSIPIYLSKPETAEDRKEKRRLKRLARKLQNKKG